MNKSIMKQYKIFIIVFIFFVVLSFIGLTYAWFSATVSGNDKAKETKVESGKLSIKYTNSNEIKGENILPGWSETKTFTVENTGTVNATYCIVWANLLNEFVNKEDLVYTLTSDNNGGILSESQMPESGNDINILENITINPEVTQTYILTVTYKNKDKDQSSDVGKRLLGKIEVKDQKEEQVKKHSVNVTVLNGRVEGSPVNSVNSGSDISYNLNPSSSNYTDATYYCNNGKVKYSFNNNTLTVNDIKEDTSCIVEYYIPTNSACFNFDSLTGTVTDYYDYEGGGTSGIACPRDVNIPSKINGVVVKSIGEKAFYENNLTSIKLPHTIKVIGSTSLARNNLTNIIIPSSVTSIEDTALVFNNLTTVLIPNSVNSIGRSILRNNQLSDESAFIYDRNSDGSEDKTKLNSYAGSKINNVLVPENVNVIENYAFYACELSSVIISDNVAEIGTAAFEKNQLTSVIIPDSVTKIENYAFTNNQLTSVKLSKNLKALSDYTFWVNNLSSIEIPDSVEFIGNGVFAENTITSVSIPDNVKTIGYDVFYKNQLNNVVIGKSVSSIGKAAFGVFSDSNQNLTRIINKSGNSFDWGLIVSWSTGNNFVTGSFTTNTGKTLTISAS